MLPSILAKQLEKGIGDYIETTFPMTNEPFKGSVQDMLATKGSVYHEPYVAVRRFVWQMRCRLALKQSTLLTSLMFISRKPLSA